MKISFFGGAGTVTGSKFLVETEQAKVLVDCGLFQGLKELRLRNWQKPPFAVEALDAVILSHAHIDHSGYVPVLVRDGFKGPIYCSEPTRDLCHVLLPDCGRINEEDANYANRKGFSKHKPALPIYTEQDALRSLRTLKPIPLESEQRVGDLTFRLHSAGHILGATNVTLTHKGRSVVFSGDVGRYTDLLESEPQAIEGGDVVVMETTYGDRCHDETPPIKALAELVKLVHERKSVLLIPSFALGRAQLLLYCFYKVFEEKLAPRIPIFVNSPMATQITNLYKKYPEWHRLSEDESDRIFSLPTFIGSVEESIGLNRKPGPMIIISASGMMTGGRILHHIKKFAPDQKNILLLPGYQAAGTRGASLVAGSRSIKIHGEYVPINAEVRHWDILSAHADQNELLRWLGSFRKQPHKVFLVHGEPASADNMRRLITEKLGCSVTIPHFGSSYDV